MALSPCETCARHVRDADVNCPFCGVTRQRRARLSSTGLGMTVLAAGLSGCAAAAPAGEPARPEPARVTASPAPGPMESSPTEPVAPVRPDPPAQQPDAPPDYRAAAAYGAPPAMSPQPLSPSSSSPAPIASAASVEISDAKATGVLGANGSAERVVQGARTGLGKCYQRALVNTATAAGAAKFRISVGVGGTVLRVETPTTGGLPAGAVSCMVTQLGMLQFNQGSTSTVSFTATFKP